MRFLQVGAAGFRAAQAKLRLLLRHREAGVGGVQVGEGKNQSCQGSVRIKVRLLSAVPILSM
jgi:hypothetical protein